MSEELSNILDEVYKELLVHFNKVKDIFIEYFGEERVDWKILVANYSKECIADKVYINFNLENNEEETIIAKLQEILNSNEKEKGNAANILYDGPVGNIIVHFPEVKVTNENGNFTTIKDLFAKVAVYGSGTICGSFKLLRTHYTYAHFKNNYMHSHVANIPLDNIEEFQPCCKGSGPINDTIYELYEFFSEEQWMQFCWDLDKYVTVESLSGIPYHKLIDADCEDGVDQQITLEYYNSLDRKYCPEFDDFKKYLLENKLLRFRWVHHNWELAHSYSEYALIVTKAFFNWVKETSKYLSHDLEAFINDLMITAIYKSDGLYTLSARIDNLKKRHLFEGKPVLTFKGTTFFGVIDPPAKTATKLKILSPTLLKSIYKELLYLININYGRNEITLCNEEK